MRAIVLGAVVLLPYRFTLFSNCKHQRDKLLDGWIPCCDAFPEGIPLDFKFGKVKEMKECNNGIGFEKKEE